MSITRTYEERNASRQTKLEEATMEFIKYFIYKGDTLAQAQDKVAQVSTENALYLFPYILGNTEPLKQSIQNSLLPFMDQDAKNKLTNDLTF